MNDELKLRNRLKEARFEKKLSQSQLAEMVTVFDKGIIINHNKNRANLH